MTEEHDHVADLLPAYALWAVTDEERAQVERHLPTCAACRAEVIALRGLAYQLPLAVDDRPPPAGLRQRVMREAQADQAVRLGMPPPPAPSGRKRWHWRWPAPSVLAASLLLCLSLGLGGWNLQLQRQVSLEQQRQAVLQQQQTALEQQREEQERRISQLQAQITSLQAQPSVRLLATTGTADAPGAIGQLLYVPQQHLAYLSVRNLPIAPAGQTYQVWFIQDGQPIDAGLLPTSRDQAAARLDTDLSRYQAVAISREPSGGSRQPTGPVVVVAPVTLGNA